MKMCCICGCILTEGKCLSCGHQECEKCAPYVEKLRLELTVNERNALLSILIDHVRQKDSTLEWIDLTDGTTVTLERLMTLVSTAPRR